MRTAPPLTLTRGERRALGDLLVGHGRRVAQRATIVLLADAGFPNRRIATVVGLNQNQVGMWRKRYLADGLAGLTDRPRPGRPRRCRRAPGCTCPCHRVVEPGLVPCPWCER